MKNVKKKFAVFLVLAVAVNLLFQGSLGVFAQSKPSKDAEETSVKNERVVDVDDLASKKVKDSKTNETTGINKNPGAIKKWMGNEINEKRQSEDEKKLKTDKPKVKDRKENDEKSKLPEEKKAKKLNEAPIVGSQIANGLTVFVVAPKGSFPEGTALHIKPLSGSNAASLIKSVSKNMIAEGFDISFTNKDGKKVQPKEGTDVDVKFVAQGSSSLGQQKEGSNKESKELSVYHVQSKSSVKKMGTFAVPRKDSFSQTIVKASGFSPYVVAKGGDDVSEKTDVTVRNFTIEHTNGSTSNEFDYYERVKLNLDWDASSYGNTLKENDFFIVKLPDNMRFPTNHAATHFDLKAPDDTVVAKAVITPGSNGGGTLKATFTNFVENRYDIKGKMQMEASFWGIKHNEENTFNVTVGKTTKVVKIKIKGPEGLKDEVVNKWNGAVDGEDEQALWFIRLNHMKGKINHYVYKDRLFVKNGDLGGVHYIPDSFILKEVECDEFGNIKKEIRVINTTGMLKLSDDKTSFVLDMGDLCKNGQQYHLSYKTTYIPGTILNNEAKAEYDGKSKIVYSSFRDAASSGSGDGSLMSKITIRKVDAENNQILLPGAVFKITDSAGQSFNLTTGPDGSVTSKKLIPGQFKIKEVTPPTGYELNTEEYTIMVTADDATIKTITDKPKKVSFCGKKTWKDNEDQDGVRPDKIIIRLLANGNEVQNKTVTKDDDWKWSFKDLPKFKEGKEIVYTITEDAVKDYTSKVEKFDVTNTHAPGKTGINVTKKWNDKNDKDKIRPGKVTIRLYADGKDTGKTLELSKSNNWTGSFSDLDEKKDGKIIKYTVKEDKVDKYTAAITGNAKKGYVVTNTHNPTNKPPKPPQGENKKPKTGDNTNLVGTMGVLIVSLLVIAGIAYKRKKNSN